MGDSENSHPKDESDEDIYKDFPVFNFEDELAKLEESKETYKQESLDLSEKLKSLTEENKDLKKSNEVLKKNLSTLLKTAQAEVRRKDSMIEQLRNEVESLTFRRNKKKTKEVFTTTDDLEVPIEVREHKSVSDETELKFYDNRTSGASEYRLYEEEEKRRLTVGGEKSCDSNGKSCNYYGDESTRYRKKHHSSDGKHSERYSRGHPNDKTTSSSDPHKGHSNKRSSRERDKRRSQKEPTPDRHRRNHKGSSTERKRSRHKDSPEKRKSRHKDSPEKRRSRHTKDSPERRRRSRHRDKSIEMQRNRRREESPNREKSQRRDQRDERKLDSGKEGSSSSMHSRGSKESSLDKPNKDSVNRIKDSRETDSIRNSAKNEEVKKLTKGLASERTDVDAEKNGNSKEKHSGKNDKKSSLPKFETRSPLDALYNEMVTTRGQNRFSNAKTGVTRQPENEVLKSDDRLQQEDWALSFKNERPNTAKPMTLYSKRMLQKFAKEAKTTNSKEEPVASEVKTSEKIQAYDEKEPGELTDDESVVESSKEFQELTKVASIDNIINEDAAEEKESKNSSTEVDSKSIPEIAKPESEDPKKKKESTPKMEEENNSGKRKRKVSTKKENDVQPTEKTQKRRRETSECDSGEPDPKKTKTEPSRMRTRSKQNSKDEPEPKAELEEKKKGTEDISTFEFFKPIVKKTSAEETAICNSTTDFHMTTRMSVRGVVCLETPDKRGEKVKNLVINEETIYHVMDSKNSSPFSPLVASKIVEMTPRRLLKNDLMLTDSEDESEAKPEPEEAEDAEDGETSECYSDSGASDFVDLL